MFDTTFTVRYTLSPLGKEILESDTKTDIVGITLGWHYIELLELIDQEADLIRLHRHTASDLLQRLGKLNEHGFIAIVIDNTIL